MGQGVGLQGKSYAIPSMGGLAATGLFVKQFCEYAKAHPEKRFLVTRIGCGIAGYSVSEIAPFFKECVHLENVTLPSDFWHVLELDTNL